MKKFPGLLVSPLFLLGLAILLLNDFWGKQAFPGFLTGKLSDVAGLFIFPLFFAGFFPKHIKPIYFITGIAFIFFKSPVSQFFIQIFNQHMFFSIARVVDYSDLMALSILPFSYKYVQKRLFLSAGPLTLPVTILAAFAFMATSRAPRIYVKYEQVSYSFQYPVDSLKKNLFFNPNIRNYSLQTYRELEQKQLDTSLFILPRYTEEQKRKCFNEFFKSPMYIQLHDSLSPCRDITVKIRVEPNRKISRIRLEDISYRFCESDSTRNDKETLQKIFEKLVIYPMQHE